jgi:hypothetical protein
MNSAPRAGRSAEKRHIKFDKDAGMSGCYNIGSKRVCRLRLGPGSVSLDTSKNYTGFTLYHSDGGVDVGSDEGLMHFVDGSVSLTNAFECCPPTLHAGAYYSVYHKCPEKSTGLVASGYCYTYARGLGYNSGTFNCMNSIFTGKPNTYLALSYYENDQRAMNPSEQTMLQNCYNKWRNDKFPVTDNWRCNFADFRQQPLSLQVQSSAVQCPECQPGECNVVGGAGTIWHPSGGNKFLTLAVVSTVALLLSQYAHKLS